MAFTKSTVGDLISFEASENPPWTTPGETWTYDHMLQKIIDYQKQWPADVAVDSDRVKDIKRRFQAEFCITNTDPPRDESKKETKNVMAMLQYFENLITDPEEQQEEEEEEGEFEGQQQSLGESGREHQLRSIECIGLLEKSMLKEAHCIAVEGINTKKGLTKPGVFSDKPRFTTYKGREYWYQQPDDMSDAVDLVLDRFNSLLFESKCKTDDEARIGGIFKSVAWLVFELLDLHPFGNGNGRLCRVLCSYVLSLFTPFPSPIYFPCKENVGDDHSQCPKPCKDDYEEALVDARESKTRHPRKLLTMIVESNWKMWKEFMRAIEDKKTFD